MASKLPVCPHCGSKNVTAIDGFFRCEDCNNDFGRQGVSDAGVPLEECVRGLRFRYGDIVNGSVRLRIVQDENDCLFEVYDAKDGGVDKVADVLSLEEWADIKHKLFTKMFVQDWEKEYIPSNDGTSIPDNNEWELALDISDDEELVYRGFDAEPVYWKDLMKIMNKFFARLAEE